VARSRAGFFPVHTAFPVVVMQLVEGEALKGLLPLETALDYSRQIAHALGAAHEKGIVHRDLKPGNIMVTPAGVVKVLDFGLARVAEEPSSDSTRSAAETIFPTRAGMILGTAAYMSPEHAEGRPVDKRSDVWSFGLVLYEMLTGRCCFDGKTANHVILPVLEQEPNWEARPASLPSGLRELPERCLRKDPSERPRDVRDLGLQIQDLAEGSTPDNEEQNRLKSVPLLWP
jgi:serine/threonine-protein kinase